MRKTKLRLHVDPPYEGESLSSFIGRAAQFYRTPVSDLLKDLGQYPGRVNWRPDIDLLPLPELQLRLGEAVPNWRSPVERHQGFRCWVLGPYQRTSYCVRCFEDDLANGRTPYFRTDWVPVLVTSCWKHRLPLLNWLDIDNTGCRRLPNGWIYRTGNVMDTPQFFVEHQKKLAHLSNHSDDAAYASLRHSLRSLEGLQRLMEKQSEQPMPSAESSNSHDYLREFGETLICASMKFWRQTMSDRMRPIAVDPIHAAWFDPFIDFPLRTRGMFVLGALRRAANLTWRRSYFWFAARALAAGLSDADVLHGAHADRWWGLVPMLGHDLEYSSLNPTGTP